MSRPADSTPGAPPRPLETRPPARAAVQSDGKETSYLVAGHGRPVLLLHGVRGRAMVFAALTEILRGRRRLIQPEQFPVAPQAISAWLRCLLDGLGLPPVAFVAHGELAMPALTFALLEPERVTRIVLVQDDLPDHAVQAAILEDRLIATGHPLLVVRRTPLRTCSAEIRAALGAFLCEEGDDAPA